LYPKDEIMPILDNVRARAKKAGRDGSIPELYMYFVDQCRTNLHMVIAMSPFGDAFRTRLRMFPSLVNCCTIDWFSEWPEEALRSVATNFVASVSLNWSSFLSQVLHANIEIYIFCFLFLS
jgi:dynein heavy chain